METKNVYSDLPDQLPEEVFETLVKSENIKIERIISPKNHKTPDGKWFNQDLKEFVILLQGSAVLLFKENTDLIYLKPGDYINIPLHKKHRVVSTDEEVETIWLAIHYK
jgi:cupin 2 domain-containing protein